MNEKTWKRAFEDLSSFTAKLDSKGRIIVPKEVRKIKKISPSSKVRVALEVLK
ncbi:MAG: hypothetical protein ACE5J7_02990 [Candidatus Aenigmatarchaeota archaeon]